MKQLQSIAANFLASWDENDKLVPHIEIAVVTAEPRYSVDLAGDVNRSRAVDEYRFSATPVGLRQLAKQLEKYADDADALMAKGGAK